MSLGLGGYWPPRLFSRVSSPLVYYDGLALLGCPTWIRDIAKGCFLMSWRVDQVSMGDLKYVVVLRLWWDDIHLITAREFTWLKPRNGMTMGYSADHSHVEHEFSYQSLSLSGVCT